MSKNTPLLSVENLAVQFGAGDGAVRAVQGVGFDIYPGETFALLGESGCGKSVSALSIMRLVPEPAGRITSGSVQLEGEELLTLPEFAMRTRRGSAMSMIFQEPMTSLNPVLTVGDQIGETLRTHGKVPKQKVRARCIELLDEVGIAEPAKRVDEYPHQLSGGMKQRVMIAIALAAEPLLLIADEPTTALDVTIQAQVLGLLSDLQKRTGMAILLITHDLTVVAEVADRVAVMYAGQIVEQATRDQFFSDAKHPYSVKLLSALPSIENRSKTLEVLHGVVPKITGGFTGCRFASRCDFAADLCRERDPKLVTLGEQLVRCHLFDDEVDLARSKSTQEGSAESPLESVEGEPLVLELDELKVHYPIRKGVLKRTVGHVRAVDGVNMELKRGETLAVVGESGCGKTTLAMAALQLTTPTGGSVTYEGVDLTTLRPRELLKTRSDLQLIFQDPYTSMNPRMTVFEIVAEGMAAQKIGSSRNWRRDRVRELLSDVGLDPSMIDRYPNEFSGGQRQRICIARALAVEPKVIVCDEPTSALDVSVQAQILNLLKDLQRERDLSYLFITHNLAVVEYLAHRVAVMYLGRIVEEGDCETILQSPRHPYTKALLAAVPKISKQQQGLRSVISGEMPSPISPPSGCHFHPRCERAEDKCAADYPDFVQIGDRQRAACFFAGE